MHSILSQQSLPRKSKSNQGLLHGHGNEFINIRLTLEFKQETNA
jgi:hypothetical protein